MRKRIIVVTLLIFFTSIGYAQSDKININSDNLTESNYLKADSFYLTHYLYIDLFLRESLFLDVSEEEVSYIIAAIKKYVSPGSPLEIEIEKPGKRNYLIKVGILRPANGEELLVAYTNWNVKERKFEKGIHLKDDCYTRWYFLNGDKMTYRKDMSRENDYSSFSKSDLANAYLFDELSENDTKIESTILESIQENKLDLSSTIMDHLILLKYQIFKRDSKQIDTQIKQLDNLFGSNIYETNLKGLEVAFEATKFQIELMK